MVNVNEPRATPALAVVLVTDSLPTVAAPLATLAAQQGRERMELVVAVLGGGAVDVAELERLGFARVAVVPSDDPVDLGRAELLALEQVSAPFVVFAEASGVPLPGCLAALLTATRPRSRTTVGPAIVSANPGTATAWAGYAINYLPWSPREAAGPRALLPGHHSAYERRAMLALGDELPALLPSLTAVQVELLARGGTSWLEPAARVAVLNVSRPLVFLVDQFGKGRQYATFRRRRWTPARRLLYAAGSPLIPAVRLARVVAALVRHGSARELVHGARLAWLAAGLAAGALGELTGYAFGGATPDGFFERVLHRRRFVRAGEGLAPAPD